MTNNISSMALATATTAFSAFPTTRELIPAGTFAGNTLALLPTRQRGPNATKGPSSVCKPLPPDRPLWFPGSECGKVVNGGNLRAHATKPLSSRDVIFRKNNERNVQFPTIKVKASLESDVLDKGSVEAVNEKDDFGVVGVHHVGILCENLERSLNFYQNILGLPINEARPHDKLPYRGAWLWVGPGMIHLMELPNPDPLTGRPEHGGRDRHACIAIRDVSKLKDILDKAGIPYTLSRSGRPAIFTRDPDANALEFTQVD